MGTNAEGVTVAGRPVGQGWSARLRSVTPAGTVVAVGALLVAVEPNAVVTTFATVFLGVFFEAVPFLLLGVLASATMQTFVPSSLVERLIPRGRLRAALAGATLGMVFPVCECGVIPVARRLLDKGASLPAALGLMLAGPVVNPIVFWATWTALGPGLATLRLVTSLLMAVAVAWIYGFHPDPARVVTGARFATTQPTDAARPPGEHHHPEPERTAAGSPAGRCDSARTPSQSDGSTGAPFGRLFSALGLAGDEMLDLCRYLVVGAAAAALLRTVVPGSALIATGQSPIVSVPLSMALAALLSICSVVDAFVALSFAGLVPTGAILAFLVYGPVVDVKGILLYGTVLRWRTVAMLVILLTQLALLTGIAVSLNLG